MSEILITKASGETQPFSIDKLRRSLSRSGAPAEIIDAAVKQVAARLRPGMTTHEIYRLAFKTLKTHRPLTAARYSMKHSIIELGPTGHPFEKLVAEILRVQGFDVKVGQVVKGHCVTHEVDVVAEKDDRRIMAECKFHHEQGLKVDVKVALYVRARFEDTHKAWQQGIESAREFQEAWLVTNAKMTSDAIQYAACAGLTAVSWDYPQGGSLPVLIERGGLHLVTALTGLSAGQKRQLVEKEIILCTGLTRAALLEIGLTVPEAEEILQERERLCRTT